MTLDEILSFCWRKLRKKTELVKHLLLLSAIKLNNPGATGGEASTHLQQL